MQSKAVPAASIERISPMPKLGKKKFAYTTKGKAAYEKAKKAKKKKKPKKR